MSVHNVEDALLRGDDRRQLGENHAPTVSRSLLALQHAGELREIRLEPVLLVVAQCRVFQVANHLVDVVLHERDFALGIDLNRSGQVALGHRGRDVGDCAQLRREVRRQLIHVVGQIAPCSRGAGHVRLAAEFSFHTHFARHRRDLIGEGRQRVRHAVDRVGEFRDFAFCFDEQFLFQIAVRDRGHDLGDTAHLIGQVAGHEIHAVGQILPGAADALHDRLAAEFSFGAHFARHARHFRGEGVQLIHHGVDGVLQLENFAFHIDRDFLRQVTARDCCRDRGNVSHLRRQVRRHEIHRVSQIFPGAGNAFHPRLTTERSFRTHFARHARHFRREGTKLIHHRVDRVFQFQNFAAHIDRDLFRQVTVRDRGRDFGDVTHLAGQVTGHRVHGVGQIFPRAGNASHIRLAAEFSFVPTSRATRVTSAAKELS